MKVAIQDPVALRALKPLELTAYLRSKGWRWKADLHGKGSLWVWRSPEGREFDVALPSKREVGDYALRISELIHTVAEAESRSQLDVLRDVETAAADVIRVRASSQEAAAGSLPLERGVAFIERCRDLVLAAACTALDKRAYFAKRKPQQAMDYLTNVRMGQTERGSFVLTMLSPVPPALTPSQGSFFTAEPPEPYERQVVRTLIDALDALGGAAREAAAHGGMEPFQQAVSRGVSANLCEAVIGLSAVDSGEGLDVNVSWSPSRPAGNGALARVQLGGDSIPIIREAARQFRETAPAEDLAIEGVVTRLDRGADATEGDVTIAANVEEHLRRVVVRLAGDTYSQAVKAHDNRQTVKCTGDLVKEGRGYRLQNPRYFEVVLQDI